MRKLLILLMVAFVVLAWFSLPVPLRPPGEAPSGAHASHGGDPATLSDGVVVSIDRKRNNVTISHGPIANLGMPGMTMGFQAGDPALLDGVKPGDKVRFRADVVAGAITVMKIERVN